MSLSHLLKIFKNQKVSLAIDLASMIMASFFLFNLVFQDTDCKGNFFCWSNPDFLKHSVTYDIFFLRAGLSQQNAHWSVELLIPVFFFVVMFAIKSVKFSVLYLAFFLCYHELLWSLSQALYRYGQTAIWEIFLCMIVSSVILIKPKLFLNKSFLVITLLMVSFLVSWYVFDDLHVTVELQENQINMITPYHSSLKTNFFEVGFWFVAFILLVLHIIRHKSMFKAKEGI